MDEDDLSHLKDMRCFYCEDDLRSAWESSWEGFEHHYKIVECGCGKKNWFKVGFIGSGHDSAIEGVSALESSVLKVCER